MGKIPEWVLNDVSPKQDIEARRGSGCDPWLWICPVHGEYKQQYCHHLRSKSCPSCNKSRKSKEQYDPVPDWALEDVSPNQDLNAPRGQHDWLWICPVHGEYKQTYGNHIHTRDRVVKHGCPECARIHVYEEYHNNGMRSKSELDIQSFCEEQGFVCRHAPREIDGTFEIDIMIDGLKRGIEVDGLGHEEVPAEVYGTLKAQGKWWYKPEGYHARKDFLAQQQGITLLHVTDDEWRNNNEETKKRILDFLNN